MKDDWDTSLSGSPGCRDVSNQALAGAALLRGPPESGGARGSPVAGGPSKPGGRGTAPVTMATGSFPERGAQHGGAPAERGASRGPRRAELRHGR